MRRGDEVGRRTEEMGRQLAAALAAAAAGWFMTGRLCGVEAGGRPWTEEICED